MRFAVFLLLAGCGTTLDGGIHAQPCGSSEASGLPLCRLAERCNSVNDCIPACGLVGCIEGACVHRTAGCTQRTCAGKPRVGECMDCALTGGAVGPLAACLCAACAAECGTSGDCSLLAPGTSDACAECAINALVHPGLCSSDARFQDDCFGSQSPACRQQAQGIVACRRG